MSDALLLRVSEAEALNIADVQRQGDGRGTVTVTSSKPDQDGRGHVRYLGAATMQRIGAWIGGDGINATDGGPLPGACRGTRSGSAPLSRSPQPGPAWSNCRKRAIGRRPPCRRTTHGTSSQHAAPSPSSATRRAGRGRRGARDGRPAARPTFTARCRLQTRRVRSRAHSPPAMRTLSASGTSGRPAFSLATYMISRRHPSSAPIMSISMSSTCPS